MGGSVTGFFPRKGRETGASRGFRAVAGPDEDGGSGVSIHIKVKAKAASKAGNWKTNKAVCDAWLAHLEKPRCKKALDKFGDEVDKAVRAAFPCAPDRVLEGRENEVRQDAALIVIMRYLPGSKKLAEAITAHDVPAAIDAVGAAVGAALFRVTKELRRRILAERKRYVDYDPENPEHAPPGGDPSQLRHVGHLSYEQQRALALTLLKLGVSEGKLDRQSANIARTMIESESNQSDTARALGCSARKVCGRLKKVRNYMHQRVDDIEFPMG